MSPLLSILCEIVAKQNWIFVSILVPISLTYDFVDYGKYYRMDSTQNRHSKLQIEIDNVFIANTS